VASYDGRECDDAQLHLTALQDLRIRHSLEVNLVNLTRRPHANPHPVFVAIWGSLIAGSSIESLSIEGIYKIDGAHWVLAGLVRNNSLGSILFLVESGDSLEAVVSALCTAIIPSEVNVVNFQRAMITSVYGSIAVNALEKALRNPRCTLEELRIECGLEDSFFQAFFGPPELTLFCFADISYLSWWLIALSLSRLNLSSLTIGTDGSYGRPRGEGPVIIEVDRIWGAGTYRITANEARTNIEEMIQSELKRNNHIEKARFRIGPIEMPIMNLSAWSMGSVSAIKLSTMSKLEFSRPLKFFARWNKMDPNGNNRRRIFCSQFFRQAVPHFTWLEETLEWLVAVFFDGGLSVCDCFTL
jgi:hypothetical protein